MEGRLGLAPSNVCFAGSCFVDFSLRPIKLAPRDGLAPSPLRLTGGWTTLIPSRYEKLVEAHGIAPRLAG